MGAVGTAIGVTLLSEGLRSWRDSRNQEALDEQRDEERTMRQNAQETMRQREERVQARRQAQGKMKRRRKAGTVSDTGDSFRPTIGGMDSTIG